MSAQLMARLILSILIGGLSLVPIYFDVRRAHVTHPRRRRSSHSQSSGKGTVQVFTSTAELALVWWHGPELSLRFYLVAILTVFPIAAAFMAMISPDQFGEGSEDSSRYVGIRIRGQIVEFDIRLILVPLAIIMLVGALLLF